MLSITTTTFDINGHLLLHPDASSELKGNRRVNRTATLDGECSITDQGFSHADRTLSVRQDNIDETDADRIWYLVRTYSLINVCIQDGAFRAAIQDININEGILRTKILIKEKLS
jgi:hypothetical protein